MPLTGHAAKEGCVNMHGDQAMANNLRVPPGRRVPWRTIGWGSALVLLIVPFVAMQVTPEMDWGTEDFLFVAALLTVVGGLIELGVRASPRWDYRAGFALALIGACLVVWVNLAVGIVGSEDNVQNQGFFLIVAAAAACAFTARLEAGGMARAMLAIAGLQALLGAAIATAPVTARVEPNGPAGVLALSAGFTALWLLSGFLFHRSARRPA